MLRNNDLFNKGLKEPDGIDCAILAIYDEMKKHDDMCLRRHYGAAILNSNFEIVSMGFNTSPGCVAKGKCHRVAKNIPHGESYEECASVHAEQQALINCHEDTTGKIMILYGEEADGTNIPDVMPCKICDRMIKFANIDTVIKVSSNYLKSLLLLYRNNK